MSMQYNQEKEFDVVNPEFQESQLAGDKLGKVIALCILLVSVAYIGYYVLVAFTSGAFEQPNQSLLEYCAERPLASICHGVPAP